MNQRFVRMLKLEAIFQFLANYCLSLMKSRQFLEFVSSQFIANAMGVIDQCSIVVCNVVFRSLASTSFEFIFSYSLSCIT